MRPDHDDLGAERHYRRGAVMGLTVAEAFMLIAFALLLLFALWRWESERKLEANTLLQDLPDEQREWVLEAASNGSLETVLSIKSEGGELAQILVGGGIVEADKFRRLFGEEDLKRLEEAVLNLPAEGRRDLVNLVSLDGFENTFDRLAAIADLLEEGHSVDEIRRALELQSALGPDAQRDLDELKARIRNRLTSEEAQQAALAAALEREIGELVSGFGGSIEADGGIVLPSPDGVLFAQGSAEITPGLRRFLSQACSPWINVLMTSGLDIDEIRIEGHASSEWRAGTPAPDAYLHNLRLSQDRAQAVLASCLEFLPNLVDRDWAQARTTAIGYSSARPVILDGREDAVRSRRVVFNVALDRDRLVDEISNDVAASP